MSSRIISQNYPPKPLWETLGMRESTSQQPKIYSFSPPEKSSLINLHFPLSSVILSPSNRNFRLGIFICSCSHCCCIIFFNFRLYMYTHVMLILINQCLLNVVFSITKALNGQISPKQHFYYPHLSMLFRKFCFS